MATIRKMVMFGLGPMQFPVSVVTAVSSTDVRLSGVCNQGHEPTTITQPKVCPTCQATDGFVKGRREGNRLIVLDEDELAALRAPEAQQRAMDFTVHPAAEVDRLTHSSGSLYYLAPTEGAPLYEVIFDVVQGCPDLAFLTTWVPRGSLGLWRLTTLNGRLAISQLAWPTSIVEAPSTLPQSPKHDQLVSMVLQFVEAQSTAFSPDTYVDDRPSLLREIVDAKEGTTIAAPTKIAKPDADTSLLEALEASIAQSKAS